jgi:hypothetical protein
MKLIVFIGVALIMSISTGCVSKINVDTVNISATKEEMTISIGDIFFEREVMTGKKNVGDPNNSVFGGDAYRIELVVEAVSKEYIKLGYSEYMKPPSPYGYYYDRAWLKKPAFSRTLEYNLKESKLISYKEYDFEIKNIQGSKITYKRIK